MNQKIVVVPFEGGYAKLLFKQEGTDWTCVMSDDLMHDLQSYLNGEEPLERVRPYVDLGVIDSNNNNFF